MNEVVIDASVVLRWAFDDELDREGASGVAAALVAGHLRALGPPTFLPEVAGVLVRAIRDGRITRELAEGVMSALSNVAIDETEPHGFAGAAMTLALGCGLHVQDASYLETARRAGAMLISADRAQVRAAEALGIPALALRDLPPSDRRS